MTTTESPQRTLPPQETSLIRAVGPAYFPIAFISRFPFSMLVVGTLTLIVAARDSVALGGLNSAVVGLGSALFGPLLGMAVDRFGQRRVVLLTGAVNALAMLALAAVAFSDLPDIAVLAVGFVLGATGPQIGPLSRSRLVEIIHRGLPADRRARTVNSTIAYESAVDETAFVFGPVVVGLLATTMSPAAPMIGAAVLAAIFVTAFALHPSGRLQTHTGEGEPPVAAPVRSVLAPRILVVVLGMLGVGFFFGTVLTSLTAYLADFGTAESAGLYYGMMGVGSTILALSVAVFPERFALWARWLVFAALMLAAMLVYGSAESTTMVVVGLAIAGLGIGPTLVTIASLAAHRSPPGRSATVMTMLGSATIVGQSASSAITGIIAESSGAGAAMWLPVAAAGFTLLLGLANLVIARRG